MGEGVNRHNSQVVLDNALAEIAAARDAAIKALTPDQQAANAIVAAVARVSTGLDQLRKQLQPRLWEVEMGFGSAGDATSPRLLVDLPGALTWFQVFHASATPTGTISFYDQDGAREKMRFSITATGGGPSIMSSTGVLFRKNISVNVASDTGGAPPYPLYVILQGISISQ